MQVTPRIPLLVIGYGNTLRSDDGVGPRTVEALEALALKGVATLVYPQLTPEIAEPISRAERVVFVDASADGVPGVKLREVTAAGTSQVMAHAANPQTMLALSRDVFHHCPQAWCLTIPAVELGIGEELTPQARRGLAEAIELLKDLASRI